MRNLIAQRRRKLGLSQRDLARLLCVPFQRLSEWERDVKAPHLETALRLAHTLKCHVDDLFFLE